MTSMLERAPSAHPFVSQTVRVGEQCVDLTAQRTTCLIWSSLRASTRLNWVHCALSTDWPWFIAAPGR